MKGQTNVYSAYRGKDDTFAVIGGDRVIFGNGNGDVIETSIYNHLIGRSVKGIVRNAEERELSSRAVDHLYNLATELPHALNGTRRELKSNPARANGSNVESIGKIAEERFKTSEIRALGFSTKPKVILLGDKIYEI